MAQGIEIVRDEVTGTARHDVTRRLTGSSSGGELQTSIVAIPVYAYALIGWVLARLIVIMFFRNVTVRLVDGAPSAGRDPTCEHA